MQKQKRCYSFFLVRKRLISNAFKTKSQHKKKIKIWKRTSLFTTPLLTYLVGNKNLLSTRPIKTTKTIKKVFNAIVNKNKVKVKTSLQLVLILLLRKKKKVFLILNTFSIKEKANILASDIRKKS